MMPQQDPAPVMHALAREALDEARRSWPYALVLAVVLGGVVIVGAHYSTAWPSEDRPFGWPGVAGFENAVAMVRSDIVLATTLAPLAMGAMVWRAKSRLAVTLATDAALVVLGVLLATLIGGVGASGARPVAYTAFIGAHVLLALAFFSIAALCSVAARRFAMPAALGVWLVFNAGYEQVLRTILFRQEGYHNLAAGAFPTWFFVAQGFSPLTAYRGVLILWDRKFMDGLEKATVGAAALPAWLTPLTMAAFLTALWIALPLAIAGLIHWWRGRSVRAPDATPA